MASQNAMSAAGGVRAYEGSQLNMLKSDMGNYAYDASMDRGTTDTNKAWMLYGGRVAKNAGYLGAAASGISAIGSLASLGGPSAGGDTSGNNLASRNSATGGFNTRRG
jgi:hypothetical protein